VLELVRGRSGTVIGHMVATFTIVKGLPYSYNSDLQEVTPHLLRSFEITRSSTRIMAGAIGTLTVKKDEMRNKSAMGFTTATEIADTIVRATGLPFRTAHGIVGWLARHDGDGSMDNIDRASQEMIGKKVSEMGLTEKMVEEALDPWSNVERRSIIGGPALRAVERKINAGRKQMLLDAALISKVNDRLDESYNGLNNAVKAIMEG